MLRSLEAPVTAVETSSGVVDRRAALEALEARELRLLARAVGDHLPIELVWAVQEVRARRAALTAGE